MGHAKMNRKTKKTNGFIEFHFRTPSDLGQKLIDEANKDDRSAVSLFRRILTERYNIQE